MKTVKDQFKMDHIKNRSNFVNALTETEDKELIENYFDAIDEMIECEINNRAMKRSNLFKLKDSAEHFKRIEELHHKKSMHLMEKAQKSFSKSVQKLKKKDIDDMDLKLKTKDYQKALDDSVTTLNLELLEFDFDSEECEEITQVYNNQLKIIKEKGMSGIINEVDITFKEIINLRNNTNKDRGREHHSRIPWHKKLVLAGVYIVVIFFLANPLITFLAFMAMFGPYLGYALRAIWNLLKSGC
jgi:hypothetical protein